MSDERLTGRLSDEDLGRALRGALLMDASGHVPDELRAKVEAIRHEPPAMRVGGRQRFATLRGAVAAVAAVAVVAASIGLGWTLRGTIVGPQTTATPTAQGTIPSPNPTQTPTAALPTAVPVWTSLEWSALAARSGGVDAIVAWKGRLIAAGSNRENMAFWSSSDGLNWDALAIADPTVFVSTHSSGASDGLVAASSGLVAFGQVSTSSSCASDCSPVATVWISHDGFTWDRVSPSWDLYRVDIADGPNGLVAIGASAGSNAAEIWTSATGATWQRLALDPAQFPAGSLLADVRATSSGYLVGGSTPPAAAAWWSGDGEKWHRADVGKSDGGMISGIHLGAGGFTATGLSSEHAWRAWWSSDGRAWQPLSGPGLPSLPTGANVTSAIIDDGSRIVAFSFAAGSRRFWTSKDGKSWQELSVTSTIPDSALPDAGFHLWGYAAAVLPGGLVLLGMPPSGAVADGTWTTGDGGAWLLTAR